MNQKPQPLGFLMRPARKIILTIVLVLTVVLVISAIRNIPYAYKDWLEWVDLIASVLILLLLIFILPDIYRDKV